MEPGLKGANPGTICERGSQTETHWLKQHPDSSPCSLAVPPRLGYNLLKTSQEEERLSPSSLVAPEPATDIMSMTQSYSQAPLTFLDTDIGLEYGADTQVRDTKTFNVPPCTCMCRPFPVDIMVHVMFCAV